MLASEAEFREEDSRKGLTSLGASDVLSRAGIDENSPTDDKPACIRPGLDPRST